MAAATGRFDEALPLAERAVERHYGQAVAMEPGFESAQTWLAITLAGLGKGEEALAHARVALGLSASGPAGYGNLALVYALLGRTEEAEETLAPRLPEMAAFPLFIAFIYSALGREDETFEWLERAYQTRSGMYSIGEQPALIRYRAHSRLIDLLDRLGLPRPSVH